MHRADENEVKRAGGGQGRKTAAQLPPETVPLDLLIIDELGFVPLSPTGAELLFEIFSHRYECGSILVTTNLPFDEWTEVFGSEHLTGALLDVRRLTRYRIPDSIGRNSEYVSGSTNLPQGESQGGKQHVGKAATV